MPPSKTATGSATPTTVTHGFTLKNRWLTGAILHGDKPCENRSSEWQTGWYAVHTGVSDEKDGDPMEMHVREQCSDDSHVAMIAQDIQEGLVPKGSIVGLCRVAHALPLEAPELSGCGWAMGPVCMVISETLWLRRPVKHKGQLGTWPLNEMAKAAIQHQVNQCAIDVHGHGSKYPPNPGALQRMRDANRLARSKRKLGEDPAQPKLSLANPLAKRASPVPPE